MPRPDYPVTVVGAKSGHVRENHSWVIGRLLRDFEQAQAAPRVDKNSPRYEALRVSVFQVDGKRKAGVPARDWVWYSGFAVILIQVVISAIPFIVYHDWAPILITTSGTTLAFIQGSLRQWREEKWAAPTTGGWTVSLSRGNGSRGVMVILGGNHGLDLEMLAGRTWTTKSPVYNRVVVSVMALLWLMLLICVAGLEANSWCQYFTELIAAWSGNLRLLISRQLFLLLE